MNLIYIAPLLVIPATFIGSPRTRVARAYVRTVVVLTALVLIVGAK